MERVAVVAGARTPFVKAGTKYSRVSMQELGAVVLKGLVERSGVDRNRIDTFVFGTVLLDPRTPNWAREILYGAGLPKSIYAQSISNNCISGLVAVANVAEQIALGRVGCGIAGGSESMSLPPLLFSRKATEKFLRLFGARSTGERLKNIVTLRPRDFFPTPPSVKEPSTGLTMGEHTELTAKEWKIGRKEQDEVAFQSHARAARAWKAGHFIDEIVPCAGVEQDLLVRADTTIEKLSALKPVFDRSGTGTLTAGNSSALTDGASAVLLMSEGRAREEGRKPIAYIRDYEFSAIDAKDGLLMAPAIAVPRLLKRNALTLEQFDRVEIHEAFAAQVLANLAAWERGWKEGPCGVVDRAKLNVLGGSIALGHPFAATGGRIITTLARELERNNLKRGLISICAAGAMAGAMILERGE